jgi:hypoxanthine phosphoribosyltransferase
MTNNSLEAVHRQLKEIFTENKKIATAAFLNQSVSILREYSRKAQACDWTLKPASKKFWQKAVFLYNQNRWIEKGDNLYFVRSKRDPQKMKERSK